MHRFVFHHVGVVTADLGPSQAFYERLGYAASERFDDPLQRVAIVLLRRADGPMIELVQPTEPASPAAGWLTRIKSGPYHTCYEVPVLDEAMAQLREERFAPLSAPVPAVAFGGRRVVFLWAKKAGLLELVEGDGLTTTK